MARDWEAHLPPENLWPEFVFPEECRFFHNDNYNLAWYLIDRHVEGGCCPRNMVFFAGREYTYCDIYHASIRVANFIKGLGVEKGDRVAFVLLNSPQALVINFAIFRVGAVSVPVSPYWKPHIIDYMLRSKGVKLLFVSAKHLDKVLPIARGVDSIKDIVVIRREFTVEAEGITAFYEDILEKGDDTYFLEKVEPFDPCVILHTSGTTGLPKGCVHLAKNILCECHLVNKYVWRLNRGDVLTGGAPVTFAAGFGTFILLPPFAGASEILFTEFDPVKIIESINRRKPTVLTGLTRFYERLLDSPNFSPEKLSSIRLATTGGSPLEPKIFTLWFDKTEQPIYEGLGATEFLHLVASNAVRLVPKIASFGVPIPGIDIRVVNDRGEECRPGELGRMLVKGPTGPLYWDNVEKQRESVVDGYSYIGDVIFVDEEGYLHFAAREEDILKVGGRKYSPMEVEEIIREHPAVEDVGVIEEDNGTIVACVAFKKAYENRFPMNQIVQDIKSLVLKRLKNRDLVPDVIEEVPFVPRTPAGKILRWKLRKWRCARG